MLGIPERLDYAPLEDGAIHFERVAVGDAERLRTAWSDLANAAVEPNYFYAPEFVLAACRHTPDKGPSSLLVVWQSSGTEQRLIGLMPVMQSTTYWGLPIPLLHTWRNPYCSCSVPLLRRGCEAVAALALLTGLARTYPRHPAIYLHRINTDGPAFLALRDALEVCSQAWRTARIVERAIARPATDFEAFANKNWSGKRRYGVRKRFRNLAKLGEVRFEVAETPNDVRHALEEFLVLEEASWKGKAGTAMASQSATASFFRAAYQGGTGGTRAAVHSLSLDGRKIAMNILAKSGDTLWIPKIASDVAYKKFAPGVLSATDIVCSYGRRLGVHCIDSASAPGSWIEPYWNERQQLADVIVATSSDTPEYVLAGCLRLDGIRAKLGPRLKKAQRYARSLLRGTGGGGRNSLSAD